jgi:hypothetical protein
MADLDFERLTELMAQAGAGVPTAPIALYEEFGLFIARRMRRHLADLGVRNVDADDLHGLTIDACFELADHARSWSPTGGALPWVWAERRLRRLASSFVGQWSDPLDDSLYEVPAPPLGGSGSADDPDELELLGQLARRRPDVNTYAQALSSAATSVRNQRVLLAYRLQSSLGDRSPAITVGRRFDMTPAAVRQVVKRTSDRLGEIWRPADARSAETTQVAA